MTWTLVLELAGMFLRYFAPYLVGLVGHIVTTEDQARLIEILTSPEMAAALATTVVAFYFGWRAWLKKVRFGLTASALHNAYSANEVAAIAKTAAPKLSTPAAAVPKLQ